MQIKYISGPKALHRLIVMMRMTAFFVIIRANTIICYPSTINLQSIIETLHYSYVDATENQWQFIAILAFVRLLYSYICLTCKLCLFGLYIR